MDRDSFFRKTQYEATGEGVVRGVILDNFSLGSRIKDRVECQFVCYHFFNGQVLRQCHLLA